MKKEQLPARKIKFIPPSTQWKKIYPPSSWDAPSKESGSSSAYTIGVEGKSDPVAFVVSSGYNDTSELLSALVVAQSAPEMYYGIKELLSTMPASTDPSVLKLHALIQRIESLEIQE